MAPSGYNLRHASDKRTVHYRDADLGPSEADKPTFLHPDPVYDPELAAHCAFPSLPTDHPEDGPSEVFKQRRAAERA
ncbi:hypothetical protein QBC35DRAFT_390271, partial [Podospora australis]